LQLYRSIKGFENVEIMRDAYAIEYECIDPTEIYPTLMSKKIDGLFFAGQINGTSGYEEAAAQGLVAGINASLYLENKEQIVLARENSYIGVLIDDLTTKGTEEPYRMMTSRAEFRLLLRQDNADLRLGDIAKRVGLLTDSRIKKLNKKIADIKKAEQRLNGRLNIKELEKYFTAIGEPVPSGGLSVGDVIKRNNVNMQNFNAHFDTFKGLSNSAVYDVFIKVKYQGYIEREQKAAERLREVNDMRIPSDFDYLSLKGLRIEAKEKLQKAKPLTVGQASRISGVTPADVNVLIILLNK